MRRKSKNNNYVRLVLPTIAGATGYKVYGIAPIPVRLKPDESVIVEPTATGYNLYGVKNERAI